MRCADRGLLPPAAARRSGRLRAAAPSASGAAEARRRPRARKTPTLSRSGRLATFVLKKSVSLFQGAPPVVCFRADTSRLRRCARRWRCWRCCGRATSASLCWSSAAGTGRARTTKRFFGLSATFLFADSLPSCVDRSHRRSCSITPARSSRSPPARPRRLWSVSRARPPHQARSTATDTRGGSSPAVYALKRPRCATTTARVCVCAGV